MGDYFTSQGIDLGITLPLMEDFECFFVLLAYSDRGLSITVLLSLIAAITLRTTLPHANDLEKLSFRS